MYLRKAIGLLRRIKFPPTPRKTLSSSTTSYILFPSNTNLSYKCGSQFSTLTKHERGIAFWALLYGQAALFLGINLNIALAEEVPTEGGTGNENGEAAFTGLRKIEDGSVVSNIHTQKWLVFTNAAKELHMQGKLKDAENLLLKALEEAKEGFGERDPHVASACNNLAELYRVIRAFDKAAPLYLKAVNILEESYGPDDIRVAFAFDNLGQFYLVQKKLDQAYVSFERALKIKGQILGRGHMGYADTLYNLGRVIYLQGKETDSEAIILDSIRILEEAGQEESVTCLRRLHYLSLIYQKSNRLTEAENIQRKILKLIELSKGWNNLDTVNAAEELALTIQSTGSLKEAQELLERCLDVRRTILDEDHIQIGANMLRMARVAMLNSNRLIKVDMSEAGAELDKARSLIHSSIRIARKILDTLKEKRSNMKNTKKSRTTGKDEKAALFILLQSYIALGILETTKEELLEPKDECTHVAVAEHAFRQCSSTFKQVTSSGIPLSVCNAPEIKAEYLSCLKHLLGLLRKSGGDWSQQTRDNVQELEEEIKCVEGELGGGGTK